MASTGRTGVAIAELVFYTPALFIGLWLAVQHGIRRSSGVSTNSPGSNVPKAPSWSVSGSLASHPAPPLF